MISKKPMMIIGIIVLMVASLFLTKIFWFSKTILTQNATQKEEGTQSNAEKLYQTALLQKTKTADMPTGINYRITVSCCQQILKEYPASPEAEKAKVLLQSVPEQYQKQYAQEIRSVAPPEFKVKKSNTLRHRAPNRLPPRPVLSAESPEISN